MSINQEHLDKIKELDEAYREAQKQEQAEVQAITQEYQKRAVVMREKFQDELKTLDDQLTAVIENIRKPSQQLLDEKRLLERSVFGVADGDFVSLHVLYNVIKTVIDSSYGNDATETAPIGAPVEEQAPVAEQAVS